MDQKVQDRWVKCISTEGNIRGVAIQADELVQTLADVHQLKEEAICRLGEALMSALLLASYCKKGEKINLNIQGTGRYKQALVDAHPDATVRGYIIEGEPIAPLSPEEGPWGMGTLSVLRTKEQEGRQPYIGTVPLLTGHLAKDLSFYWVQSEQIPSAVGLSVTLEGGKVKSAGAFLVQAMPGASAEEVAAIEQHILELSTLAGSLTRNASPVQLLSQIFQNTPFMVMEEKPLVFQCHCSWERVRRALVLVGVDELKAMLSSEEPVIVRCDFCAKEYEVSDAVLKDLIEAITISEDTTH